MCSYAYVFGIDSLASEIVKIMFGKTFREKTKTTSETIKKWREVICQNNVRSIIAAVIGVTMRSSLESLLDKITCPVLAIGGTEDIAVPLARTKATASQLKNCNFVTLIKTGHLSTIETPNQVAAHLETFLEVNS